MTPCDYFSDLTDDEIRDYIAANQWKFARTMPKHPHEYNLKEVSTDPEFFERFVMHIRRYGEPNFFFKKRLIYFTIDGYKYWSMGAPLHETILINRAKV